MTMKTPEELKEETEVQTGKPAALSDEALKEVAGGVIDGAMTDGIAGAYGAPGTRTATGAVVDDQSMGVAIPMSWPDYRLYFGKTVMITYGGRTVLATINDVGSLTGRDLDLQPGVFRAFGVSSPVEWGLRPVIYRVL